MDMPRINVYSRTFKEGVETCQVVNNANLGYRLSRGSHLMIHDEQKYTKPESCCRWFDPATMRDGNGNPRRVSERLHKNSFSQQSTVWILVHQYSNYAVSRFQALRTCRTDQRRDSCVPRGPTT